MACLPALSDLPAVAELRCLGRQIPSCCCPPRSCPEQCRSARCCASCCYPARCCTAVGVKFSQPLRCCAPADKSRSTTDCTLHSSLSVSISVRYALRTAVVVPLVAVQQLCISLRGRHYPFLQLLAMISRTAQQQYYRHTYGN